MILADLLTNLDEELRPFQGRLVRAALSKPVKGITADSRQVQKGWVFVCIKGEHTDGHRYIGQAIKAGAIAVIIQDVVGTSASLLDSFPIWVADHSGKMLAELASRFYNRPAQSLWMVGVTGTNGKTTVSHMIEQILARHGLKSLLVGTLGIKSSSETTYQSTGLTTPMAGDLQALFRHVVDEGFQALVMEVSSHALDQYRAWQSDIDVAVFTNLTQDHLDYHKTMTEYFKAKAKLFEWLTPQASQRPKIAVINRDDEWGLKLIPVCPTNVRVLSYGIDNPDAQVQALEVNYRIEGASFRCTTPVGEMHVQLKMGGQFAVYNALAAIAAAVGMNIPLSTVKEAIESLPCVRGRFEVVASQPTVVVDYAHTPDGLLNILNATRIVLPAGGRLITVFGCGGDRDSSKRPQMGRIAEEKADILVITSDNPRTEDPQQIITDILAGIERFQTERMIVEPDRRLAIQRAIDMARPTDVVVVAGKGHEDYQILADQTIHFDDREEVQAYIKTRHPSATVTS